MDRWIGKVAVVTGTSSGIGLGIAEHLVNAGLKVVGLARRKERLDELSEKLKDRKGRFYGIKADITKENEILEAYKWITENVGIVHVLINNAGIFRPKGLLDGDTKHWKEVLDTNLLGLCIATREAIKIMQLNHVDGHIIHINSIGGHYVPRFPNVNVYPATKFGVTALTETLRQELNSVGSKIKVTSISPSYVRTQLMELVGIMETDDSVPSLKAEDIGDAVEYVLSTPPHVQVHEIIIREITHDF